MCIIYSGSDQWFVLEGELSKAKADRYACIVKALKSTIKLIGKIRATRHIKGLYQQQWP